MVFNNPAIKICHQLTVPVLHIVRVRHEAKTIPIHYAAGIYKLRQTALYSEWCPGDAKQVPMGVFFWSLPS